MRKYRQKQFELVKSLLDKPKWYNETITHKNWPLIKRDWLEYEKKLVSNNLLPPSGLGTDEEWSKLRYYWIESNVKYSHLGIGVVS